MNTQIPEVEKEYAIFETGGKQYQAVLGKTLAIEKLDAQDGETVTFDKVLFLKRGEGQYEFGRPFVAGVTIKASLVKQTKGPKLIIFKFKRRKKYRLKKGHRQPFSVVRFESF